MKRAIKWLTQHLSAALFLDPGLGKTGIVLATLRILFRKDLARRALVIAPLRVCYAVWPAEAKKWLEFEHLNVAVLHGPGKEKALRSDAQILVINPEGLQWLFQAKNWKALNADVLVIDESTRFKNSQSQRFKQLRRFIRHFRYRWILSGTPIPNGYMDLFAQIYLVDEGRALGAYITHYREKYFTPSGFGGYDWQLKPESEEQINTAIAPYVLRLQAEDYLELPDVVETDIQVQLPPKVRKIYDQMEDEAFTEIEGEAFGAGHSAAALNKCRQICNGALYKNDSREYVALHDEKLKALEELLEERSGRSTLVAYQYEHDWKQLERRFGALPRIGGGVTARAAERYIAEWNAGELPVLLVHPASAGHGLNLQYCATADAVVWYGLTFDLEQYDQLNDRLYRQGAAYAQMYIYRITAAETVELAVLRALRRKARTQRSLLSALKAYRTPE